MVYTSDIFFNLVNKYSSWQSLRTFLESEEGGNLRVIHKEDEQFAIIRYVKGQSDLFGSSKPWVRWMRSVVWDTNANLPESVAPPKAIKATSAEIPGNSELSVEEFVEGVMVNAFVESQNGSPRLRFATRSSLDAKTGFYGQKSFAEMMEEAIAARGTTNEALANLMFGHGFTFASFVLQHPEHRVVQKIEKPFLYLIHLGSSDPVGRITLKENAKEWPEGFQSLGVKVYSSLGNGETVAQRMETMIRTAESTWQGLVFRGSNGDRWRVRSLSYNILRDLRGKESRIEDRFCRLRAQNMVRLYCQNWPEEMTVFNDLEKRIRGLTSKIYTEYCAVHKEKSKQFLEVAVPLRTPVYEIHGIYLNSLRPKNLTVKMPIVIQYVNTLPLEAQANLLRSSVTVDLSQGF